MANSDTYTDNGGQRQLVTTMDTTGYTAAFPVQADKPVNIEVRAGTATGYSVQLERKLPGSAGAVPLTGQSTPLNVFTGPVSEKWVETEVGTLLYFNLTTIGSGTLTVRISQ